MNTLRRPAEPAVDLLADLVAMYDEGRREPLPLPTQDVVRVGGGRTHPRRSGAVGGYRWKSDRYPGDDAEPAHVRTWGQGAWLKVLVDAGLDRLRGPAVAADAASDGRLMDNFDLLGPLPEPRSTTVLEASAGTGKTFALAGLVTRYIAEGEATLDQMLLITFGRAATQELRDRVRRQIVDAVVAFDDPASAGDNQVIAHLLDCGEDERRDRRRRLRDALARSTPRPSPPRTSSARWCSSRSGWRATPTPV